MSGPGGRPLPARVGIVGLGVMGGSLARALAERGVAVVGCTAVEAEAESARAAGAVSEVRQSPAATALDVGCWVLATPLASFGPIFSSAFEGLERSGLPDLILDVGSLQEPALRASASVGVGSRHVSAHPMVGSERSGFQAGRSDLYEGAPVWLSAGPETTPDARDAAEAFWAALGAEPAWVDAAEHDDRMAAASHLPQLTANALAAVLAHRGLTPGELGPGGRDTTRLAASSPAMWRDLLAESAPRVAPLMRALAAEAELWAARLDAGDLDAVETALTATRAWRRS